MRFQEGVTKANRWHVSYKVKDTEENNPKICPTSHWQFQLLELMFCELTDYSVKSFFQGEDEVLMCLTRSYSILLCTTLFGEV